MKKTNIVAVCAILLAVIVLCSGCTVSLQASENAEIRQCTETMLNALITNDFRTAYSLARNVCTEEDFKPVFTQMQELLGDTDAYELKLLSIYTNSSVSNGQTSTSVSSTYEMTTKSNRIVADIRMDDQIGLCSFYLTPYENTDYYFTGTLENLENITGTQWVFLLLNVVTIGLTVFALVDCCRQRIEKKALWILLLILGFASVSLTLPATGFRLNVNLGWITAYSALICYGSGTVMFRLMLPVGAIIYFVKRRSLLNNNTPTITPSEKEPEVLEENSDTEQQSSPTSADEHLPSSDTL